MSNPADYFMTMMSRESIELDAISGTGSVFVDNDRIDQEYAKQIDMFDNSYQNSDLRSDPKEVHPGITELD